MKKSEIKKLDTIFSKKIRERGACQFCGSTSFLNCAHIISRKYQQVRWDKDNARVLCAKCHRNAHDNPLWFADKIFDDIGKQAYYELLEKSRQTKKLFFEDVKKELEFK